MSDLKDELLVEFTQEDIDAYCSYIDALRTDGERNIFVVPGYLESDFGLTAMASWKIFFYWASTFQNFLKANPDQKRVQNL